MIYDWITGSAALLLLLGLVVAWSWRTRPFRWFIMIVAVASIPLWYYATLDLLSRPKPRTKELMFYDIKQAEVRGFHIIPGVGIYLLLNTSEWSEPRYYSYEWNEETKEMARQLQEAWESAQQGGVPLTMLNPFEFSWNKKEPIFRHPPPPPTLPPKDLMFPGKPKPKEYSA